MYRVTSSMRPISKLRRLFAASGRRLRLNAFCGFIVWNKNIKNAYPQAGRQSAEVLCLVYTCVRDEHAGYAVHKNTYGVIM